MSRVQGVSIALMALIAVSGFVGGCVFNEVVIDPIQAQARAAVGSPIDHAPNCLTWKDN